jgi:hypothetical protein
VVTNPLLDSITLAGQDVEVAPGSAAAAVEKALHDIAANPSLVNVSVSPRGSPLNVALGNLVISVDGGIDGQRKLDRIRLVRALVAHGAHLNADEATNLHRTWALRRVLYEGQLPLAMRTHWCGGS